MYSVIALIAPQEAPLLGVVGQVVWFVLAFAFVIALAVLFTRWIAGAKYRRGSTGNLHVVESIAVGQQVYLQLVRTGGKYIVIGVTRGSVTFVCEVSEEEIKLPDHRAMGDSVVVERFEQYLKSFMSRKNGSEEDNNNEKH